jgi:phosphatidylglycerophosphatase A
LPTDPDFASTAPDTIPDVATQPAPLPAQVQAPRRATLRFMLPHPARWIALGFGSGLAPKAPGTVGTLWAWATGLLLARWLGDAQWAALLLAGTAVGWWACTRTAQHLGVADPGAIVWDEVLAFWLVLWLVLPAGWLMQAVAFALFRYFDAAKPGPVGWADRLFKLQPGQSIGWAQGFGILLDDFVAAGCTLLVLALWKAIA